MTSKNKTETKRRNAEALEHLAQIQAATRAVVATGKCPECGSKLRRNLSITGWWQCEQFGSEQFRARPQEKSCQWQGFTE